MCTVTWKASDAGLHILCNRDEQRLREPATPPEIRSYNDVAYLAPHDGRAGGTWFAVNEHGLAVSLLNHYPTDVPRPTESLPYTSRGELVVSLMDCPNLDSAAARLRASHLAAYRPCVLLLFQAGRHPERVVWDGDTARHARLTRMEPQSSSSFRTQAVIDSRLSLFRKLPRQPSLEDLRTFHASHHPSKGAYSVCMHRSDAHTVSFTELHLGHAAEMRYIDSAPCKSSVDLAQIAQLPLVTPFPLADCQSLADAPSLDDSLPVPAPLLPVG